MERDLLSSLEESLPIVETRFGIEIKNRTDIFKVKVGDKTYFSDILDCLSDAELADILRDKGIKANRLSRTKLVSLAKKSIRDLYISSDEIIDISNNSCYVFTGIIILSCQIIILIVFIIYVAFAY